MARSWTPKNVAIEASVRAISIATRPVSSRLPPLHPKTSDIQVLESRKQLERERATC
ncbi:MAG: hypothetical protein WCC17_18335 [Candidatus Nitrosopolaris sp.]